MVLFLHPTNNNVKIVNNAIIRFILRIHLLRGQAYSSYAKLSLNMEKNVMLYMLIIPLLYLNVNIRYMD
ncbi:hypothetical protein bsdtb5_03580 [Anaeromicropila herbilytica]|uniref:Uncharacterized protein n=1 Tax=Anaeromicropila herbilytica TaxID=2785025 RepID=A0A7R7ICK0_9FIRM|nr:hypothetical protein bsdtb5_03580 [Anaeromicropila herbilytica]